MEDIEKIRIAKELKTFLAVNGIDRGEFARRAGLGKGTVDKLLVGIFSEKTLAKVSEKTSFRLRTLYAAKKFGAYSRANWEGYIRKYIVIHPSIKKERFIEARIGSIDWDDSLPCLVFSQQTTNQKEPERIGALWIPHERSPLIYIHQPDNAGVTLIVSTMVGEPCMRGLALTEQNVLANAWVPIALPIVMKRLDVGQQLPTNDLGLIGRDHEKFEDYDRQLKAVIDRNYGRLVNWGQETSPPKPSKKRLKIRDSGSV
jgi:hypothetical protein